MPVPARRRPFAVSRSVGRARAGVTDERESSGPAPIADALVQRVLESPAEIRRLDPAAVARSTGKLQALAGNEAVTAFAAGRDAGSRRPATVGRFVQRIPVSGVTNETLLNEVPSDAQWNAGTTTFIAHGYSTGTSNTYQLTRSPAGVNVQVRIFFHDPASTATALAAADPRRSAATTICGNLVGVWNGKYEFLSRRVTPPATGGPGGATPAAGASAPGGATPAPAPTPAPAAGVSPAAGPAPTPAAPGEEVSLPVNFVATPVFDPAAPRDAEVAFHTNRATGEDAAATGGYGIIDSGNWFSDVDRRVYPADPSVIYAHEYGHLLGIPDEYSLSHADVHARIHGAEPARAAAMQGDLDKGAARIIMLRALAPHVLPRLRTQARGVARTVSAARPRFAQELTSALRSAWQDDATIDALRDAARSALVDQPRALRALDQAIDFEARSNRGYGGDVSAALDRHLTPAAVERLVMATFTGPLNAAMNNGRVVVPFEPGRCSDRDITVQVETLGLGTVPALNTAAQRVGDAVLGAPLPASPAGGASPTLTPGPGLLARLASIPAGWTGIAELFGDEASRLGTHLVGQGSVAFSDPAFGTEVHDSVPALYRAILRRFTNLSRGLAASTVLDFLQAQFGPLLQGEADALVAAIDAELGIHQTVPPGGGTNAGPPAAPDPAAAARTQAIAAAIRDTATAARTEVSAASPANLAPGATATSSSHVRYTVDSLMGDNNAATAGTVGRPDYLQAMVTAFNGSSPELRHADEADFTVRMRR
jgi:hypothetical protein